MLADEPTANLDEENATLVTDALRQANRDANATVIIVSHREESLGHGSRWLRLVEGRLVS